MDRIKISELAQVQRKFFAAGKTKDVSFRLDQLKIFKKAVIKNENAIFDALSLDLNKPAQEAYGGDAGMLMNEIGYAIKRLTCWAKPKRIRMPLAYLPAAAWVYPEPYGVALIIGPWNFPVQLILVPLVGAMAAGNCAILKPSELAPHTAGMIAKIIRENFDPGYISVVEGGAETSQALLEERFDYIFFTGGQEVGRLVMKAAAKYLTPITLELGGKSPCIVEPDVNLDATARRIAWGKFFNAGQSCVAVDYLLVNSRVKQGLLTRIKSTLLEFYGEDPSKSPDYARIVNDGHFTRLSRLLGRGKIIMGGRTNADTRYIAPTVIEDISPDDPIMQEEIFGPILPIMEYKDLSQAISFVNERPKPLALYFFSRSKDLKNRILNETSSGSVCINDTVIQQTSASLPFGGAGGESGFGKNHGKASFDAFSHAKSVLNKSFLLDLGLRYPPYKGKLKYFRKIY